MCRLCGRVVKCIFDTMPSRIRSVPSKRAFSTIRRVQQTTLVSRHFTQPTRPHTQTQTYSSSISVSSLTRSLSALTHRPTSTSILSSILSKTATRPSLTLSTSPVTITIQTPSQPFSSSATLGAKRDTYNPSRKVQKRRHGFLARIRSKTGMGVVKRRRLKGRLILTW